MSNECIGVKVCEIYMYVSCAALIESKLKFDRNVSDRLNTYTGVEMRGIAKKMDKL